MDENAQCKCHKMPKKKFTRKNHFELNAIVKIRGQIQPSEGTKIVHVTHMTLTRGEATWTLGKPDVKKNPQKKQNKHKRNAKKMKKNKLQTMFKA